jgi:hypothetical protein
MRLVICDVCEYEKRVRLGAIGALKETGTVGPEQ